MDVVYPYDGAADELLGWSIKSIRKHFVQLGEVVVIGGRKDVPDCRQVRFDDVFMNNHVGNVIRKVLHACDDESISDPFLVISDDVIALKMFVTVEFQHIGLLTDTKRRDGYGDSLRNTAKVLIEHGYPIFNYENHKPRIINKALYRRAMNEMAEFKQDTRRAPQGMSLYVNSLGLSTELGTDAKAPFRGGHTTAEIDKADHTFVSLPSSITRGVMTWLQRKILEGEMGEST